MASFGVEIENSSSGKWSLEPLLHGHLPSEVIKSLIDFSYMKFVSCMMLTLALMYPIMHKILLIVSKRYAAMEVPSKQIVVTHHALEAVVLSIVFPFFTYFMSKAFFWETNDLEETLSYFQGSFRCGIVIIMVYAFELASRFHQPRPLIIFHHVLGIMDMLLCFFFPTSIFLKSAVILTYSICYEALIFVGLFLYRIAPDRPIASHALMAGMVVFGATRPIQVLLVGAALFGSWGKDGTVVKWQVFLQFVVTMIMTTIQVKTLKIQYGLWQRCVAKRTTIGDGLDVKVAHAHPVAGIGDNEDEDIESQGVQGKSDPIDGESTLPQLTESTKSSMDSTKSFLRTTND